VPAKRKVPGPAVAEADIRSFRNQKDWENWLERHHDKSPGLWIRLSKKGSKLPSVTYGEALESALCYGWIDAQKRADSDQAFLQRFTPRRSRSIWSKINREKVLALTANGRMRPAGLEEVKRAQADGRWDAAYDSPSTATVPDDFQEALDRNPRAKRFFATLSSANRYAILWRLQTAKKPETRVRRVALFVEMLEKGETIH
jgi:uncharacterized protein YdeI (YjbR/CyaY-like superfamily)